MIFCPQYDNDPPFKGIQPTLTQKNNTVSKGSYLSTKNSNIDCRGNESLKGRDFHSIENPSSLITSSKYDKDDTEPNGFWKINANDDLEKS